VVLKPLLIKFIAVPLSIRKRGRMGLTVTEKLISAALVEGEMKKGQRIGIRADQTLSHDVNGIMSYLVLEATFMILHPN
jgi:hypothetical protein